MEAQGSEADPGTEEAGPLADHGVTASEAAARNTAEQTPFAKVLAVVSSIGPPVTVATALLVYFGWARSDAQSRAMGLDVSLFGYSVQDYALRSIRSLFFPLVCILIAGLLWLAADDWLRSQLRPGHWRLLVVRLSIAAIIGGAVLAAGCWLIALVRPQGSFLVIPFLMAAGVLLAHWGLRLRRLALNRPARAVGRTGLQGRALEATFVFTLVTILLFWGASDFAQVVGRGLAADIEAQVTLLPRADVYSHSDLAIGAAGVTRTSMGAAASPVYKYTGLHLLVLSGGRFFLLPEGWTLARGTVVVLPDNDAVRVEFGRQETDAGQGNRAGGFAARPAGSPAQPRGRNRTLGRTGAGNGAG
ncbi:hypothetical protein [Paenarthrobacter sp. Z7-10]|uniref:hypothetical protein n=1 Tax=Paenarthrobacter sp. Z7-10 TaxID=2787635 RepID=UPI0022A9F031|nr:hypothetical protein [Paenarthrobacter sp. Z7-10]